MIEKCRCPPRDQELTERARQLRRNSTGPELALWRALRGRRLAGLKFRRQVPIGRYVVDFWCEQHKLIIELDGQSHVGRAEYDRVRTEFLEASGCRVIRFDNDDVLKSIEDVLTGILLACGCKAV